MKARVLILRSRGEAEIETPYDLEVRIGAAVGGAPASPSMRRGAAKLAVVTVDTPEHGWGAALASDYLAVQRPALLRDLDDPLALAGVVWRAGARVRAAIMGTPLDAGALAGLGIADAILDGQRDPVDWVREWIGGRSVVALASAAALLRTRHGGAALERSEFTRLFSTGEPQLGLARFLGKLPLDFSETTEWEMR